MARRTAGAAIGIQHNVIARVGADIGNGLLQGKGLAPARLVGNLDDVAHLLQSSPAQPALGRQQGGARQPFQVGAQLGAENFARFGRVGDRLVVLLNHQFTACDRSCQ